MSGHMQGVVVAVGILVIAAIIGSAMVQEASGQETVGEMKRFSSAEELRIYLEENAQTITGNTTGYRDMTGSDVATGAVPQEMAESTDAPMPTMAPTAAPGGGSADDYSTTNIQVAGVDEPDFIKNDGRYIYVISGDTLVIVDAYPAEKATIVSETDIEGQPEELFLAGDRLAVITSGQEEVLITPDGSAAPVPISRRMTHVTVYSVRDRSQPEVLSDAAFTGSYENARMIGGMIYLITGEYVPWYGGTPLLPEVRTGNATPIYPDVYYPDIPQQQYRYHTISSLDIRSGDTPAAETFLLGYGSTLYASQENIYLGYRKSTPPVYAERDAGEHHEETAVYRFAIQDGAIDYAAMGSVPGILLNQFSLDEYDGYLRVATTVQGWTAQGSYQYSTVSVLDGDMETVGTIANIAPGERIYATRFIGDRLYMVTFKQIDPLFVIDLSDPEHPGILGKLKIPGYSDYLHPYDDTHLIGVGKETEANEWGGASVGGVKIALFDVSNVSSPKQIDSVEIGEAGTDSAALNDHRAFLFAKSKNLLVIPISEIRRTENPPGKYQSYTLDTWQGAYVYDVDPARGFDLRGTVTHALGDAPYSWNAPDAVRRSLYMDDVVYTVSERRIVASSLDNPKDRIGEVLLPGGQDPRYWYI
ncbi:hypothetical protein FGU65_06930 [Methanoculleus sp. FWC-SCC1]|uniref:Secreted protein containing C-terminal beta-propeller domain n=1 Tax=Methanoculleus frigidifontis TaxID=2584085 RepID=A0ABT8M9L1_9EURY|nr:beta-propeller domain-containing protein [Methanoculleus sp. FWC-SCC1]MDN7024623.1 hypothetical protein [Methanoculleus sp. FWC-SCC1]